MPEDPDLYPDEPLADQVFHQFLALLRLKRQYEAQLSDQQGIKPRDLSVLRFLVEKGPATVSQIQTFLHNSPSTASALIAQLEEAGLVRRKRYPDDNRVVIVSLTPAGQQVIEQTPLGGLPLLRRRLNSLTPERLEQINEVLQELMHLMATAENN